LKIKNLAQLREEKELYSDQQVITRPSQTRLIAAVILLESIGSSDGNLSMHAQRNSRISCKIRATKEQF